MGAIWKRLISRRSYLINREFQLGLLGRALISAVGIYLIIATAILYPLVESLQTVNPDVKGQAEVAALFLRLHVGFPLVALLTLMATALFSLRTSHRVAGPLFSIMRTLGRIRDGVIPSRTRTRDGDYFGREAEMINDVLGSIRERVEGSQEASAAMTEAVAGDERLEAEAQRLADAVAAFDLEFDDREEKRAVEPKSTVRGFTLIEIMIVIITVLAAIGIPK